MNSAAVPGLDGCIDLDFGFTPATNLLHLRRISLAEGQEADVNVAWFDVPAGALTVLPQRYKRRYKRRSETAYRYEAPTANYKGLLEVASTGFIRRYPGLWEEEH